MAHQPWKIHSLDIKGIYKENCWSFNEFVHASLIIFYFHKFATVNETLDLDISNPIENKEGKNNTYLEANLKFDGYSTSEETENDFQMFMKKREKKGKNVTDCKTANALKSISQTTALSILTLMFTLIKL
jgi:hypothetical protein